MLVAAGAAAPVQAQGQAAYSFVTNTDTDSVTEYAMGASGNETPVAIISGPATGLDGPVGVAVDSATPVATIAGPATGLSAPLGVAVDSAGHLFVTNASADSVTEFAEGATGNTAPVATISGPATGLHSPGGVAVAPALGSAPVLRFDAHAYGVHARVGRFTVGPTAPANLTCTTKPGSIRGHAFHATTTVSGTRAGDGSQQAKATSTVSGGPPGLHASGSIHDTATAATSGTSSTVTTSGSATFTKVKIDGTRMPYHPAPNTTLHLPRGTLVLNQQIPVTDSSGATVGITVNAIDATFGPVHAIIGHASAALTAPGTACPAL
jgi:hypothetical protein